MPNQCLSKASLLSALFILSVFSVLFISCGERDNAAQTAASDSIAEAQKHLPENALKTLKVYEGLSVKAMATEPALKNPTNIDVDERGRVWVTEAYNYRPDINGNPVNPEGDRIVILEDKDGDGVAETNKVFYQGPEINAPLGVCVLGNRVLISQSPYVWAFYDDNGDDKADRKEIIFQGIGGEQHDHGMHTFTFGPDGKLYFNFGNEGVTLKDKNGKVVRDQDGDEIGPSKYKQGMVFRCDPDGSNVECLGHNFRNNFEVAVDSYGNMWQSDNDDDGNRGVRINYVMDYGNYGYRDEMTGASWQAARTNMEDSIMFRHWHLNDPGVVPNLLQTGAGSPTGMVVYEGKLLPEVFRNQMIHAEPGVNVVRAYPVMKKGAGYSASITNLVENTGDQWFRPSDICVAPDGSLIVADWYDPGVGGHQAGDQQRGRIYRIAPDGAAYTIPQYDYTSAKGAITALQNPNLAVRRRAWLALQQQGAAAVSELESLWRNGSEPRMRARAWWVLVKMPGGEKYIAEAANDALPEIKIMSLRAARQLKKDVLPLVSKLSDDSSKHVLRECALALRHQKHPDAAKLWTKLAMKHDGNDRWYLEALGIAADRQWDAFFEEYLKHVSDPRTTAGGRDLVWRARTEKTMSFLSMLAADNATPLASRLRYFRAFDFNSGPEKTDQLVRLLGNSYGSDTAVAKLVLYHLDPSAVAKSERVARALEELMQSVKGTSEYLDLVDRYRYSKAVPDLLQIVYTSPDQSIATRAAQLVLQYGGTSVVEKELSSGDTARVVRMVHRLGNTGNKSAIDILEKKALTSADPIAIKQQAVRAMGWSMSGEDRVLALLAQHKIPETLIPSAVEGVKGAWRKTIYEKALAYMPGFASRATSKPEPKLNDLLALKADAENGKKVFQSTCALCHQVNGQGQKVGPDLSQIGTKLPKEGLLDAIVHPSNGISFGYETSVIDLKDGTSYTGIIASRTESEIELRLPGGTAQKLNASDVKKVSQTKESLMPALHESMSDQQLADLLEYLSQRK